MSLWIISFVKGNCVHPYTYSKIYIHLYILFWCFLYINFIINYFFSFFVLYGYYILPCSINNQLATRR